jgi:hypothetical protein
MIPLAAVMVGGIFPLPSLASVSCAALAPGTLEAGSISAVQVRLYALPDFGYSSAAAGEASRL